MNKLTIAMYHYVRRIKESRYPEIKGLELDFFIQQLSFFKENFNVIKMEDLIAYTNGEGTLPENPLLLTFDDGYAEHFTEVYPILKDFGMQGSFFIPAKTVIEHELLDVNKIHFILASLNNPLDLIDDIKKDITLYQNEYKLKDFADYFAELAVANRFDSKEIIFIKRLLQHALPAKLRNILSSKYFKKYVGIDEQVFSKELYMNKYQLKQLVRGGMHVGCHGYDHYWWNKLDAVSLRNEIELSKSFLQDLGVNMEQWTACYPYGSSSDDVVQELQKQGCSLAFTTEVELLDLDNISRFLCPRLDTNDFPPKSNNYEKYLSS